MKLAATAAGICFLAAAPAGAQENGSLTNSGLRTPQVIAGGSERLDEPLNDAPLYERLVLAQNSIKALTQSLAQANAEAETYKRQAADLTLKLQALGLAGVEKDEGKIEQRLLAAVRDLRLAKKDNEGLKSQLVQLSEAIIALLQTTEEIAPESRMAVETELRKTGDLLGTSPNSVTAEPVEATLSDAMVVEVKDELSLVVGNVGLKQNVKIGMPFQVWRGDRRIGEVRVIDVRERICGAVIQSLESEKNPVKAGDRLRVDARQ